MEVLVMSCQNQRSISAHYTKMKRGLISAIHTLFDVQLLNTLLVGLQLALLQVGYLWVMSKLKFEKLSTRKAK